MVSGRIKTFEMLHLLESTFIPLDFVLLLGVSQLCHADSSVSRSYIAPGCHIDSKCAGRQLPCKTEVLTSERPSFQ